MNSIYVDINKSLSANHHQRTRIVRAWHVDNGVFVKCKFKEFSSYGKCNIQ